MPKGVQHTDRHSTKLRDRAERNERGCAALPYRFALGPPPEKSAPRSGFIQRHDPLELLAKSS